MASIEIKLKMDGLASVQKQLARLAGGELREAQARALNDVGHRLRGVMAKEFASAFDRPTPFITRSPKFVEATPDNLSLRILPTLDARNLPGKGGKVSVDPQHVLQAQEFGGRRADKKSEKALRIARILPVGYQTAIPDPPYPGSHDGRGNLRGPFVQQLLSYLQAYSEVGFKANMGAKKIAKMRNQQGIGSISAKKVYKTTLGVRYFVSHGRIRGQHLAPGIWAAKGTHDVDVAPVLLFVRTPTYAPRISMQAIADGAGAEDYLAKRLRYRIRQIVEAGEASGVRL